MIKENTPIQIYRGKNGDAILEVQLDKNTIWLSQSKMAELFEVSVKTINEHISNIYKSLELSQEGTIRRFQIVQTEGSRKVNREIDHYNLDMIISVGYRVNSQKATHFRQRATNLLKHHLVEGYSLNHLRLKETGITHLQRAIELVKETLSSKDAISQQETQGLLEVITNYTQTWLLLYQFDQDELPVKGNTIVPIHKLQSLQAESALEQLKDALLEQGTASELFALPKYRYSLEGIFGNIYQSFDGKEVYPSVEEKAAHLLYFIIKDHPFNDGNKRSGAFLFILFLQQYGILYDQKGASKINDRGLVAIALLIAQSNPKDKDLMIHLVVNLINE